MAALPPIKRITKEDLGGAPAWIDRLLYPLNLFLNTIYGALNKNITLSENIDCQLASFTVIAGAAAINNTAKFMLTLKHPPTMLIVGSAQKVTGNYTPIAAAVTVDWNYDGSAINITAITGLTNGSTYTFNVVLF